MRDQKLAYYGKSVLKTSIAPHNVVKIIKGGQGKKILKNLIIVKQSLYLNENIISELNNIVE